jgi:hypothetical protein
VTITISLAPSGGFILGVPCPEVIHNIEIPATEAGIKLMKSILREHAKGEAGRNKISQPGNPTQWQVNEWLKADRAKRQAEATALAHAKEAAKDAAAAKLFNGIDLGELDL